MVNPRITTSDENSFNATTDRHINRCLGTIDENRSHGRLSRESEDDQASIRCKFVETLGTNINVNKKDSIINHTKTRMTSIWCTGCYREGHMENEFLCTRGMGPPHTIPHVVP
jgi:hypothetical protein